MNSVTRAHRYIGILATRFLDFARNDKNLIANTMTSRFRFGFLALTWLVTSSDERC